MKRDDRSRRVEGVNARDEWTSEEVDVCYLQVVVFGNCYLAFEVIAAVSKAEGLIILHWG